MPKKYLILHLNQTFSRALLILCLLCLGMLVKVSPVFADPSIRSGPSLQEFAARFPAIDSRLPAGLYVHNVMALPVVQQPAGQPAFVSSQPDVLTQFSLASQYGSVGLIAHNTLAGAAFESLQPGQVAVLVLANGRMQPYRITAVERYQALQPSSPYSDFLSADGARLSAEDLFLREYAGSQGRLVLQTCIASQDNPSWGRLFILAEPIPPGLNLAARQVTLSSR